MKLIAAVVIISIALWTRQALCAETITIGLIAPISGHWALEGRQMKQVVTLLAEKCNAGGGLLGKKVTIITEDDAGNPDHAVAAAQRLVLQKPAAVIGSYGSAVTQAVQEIFDTAGVVQITNGSTAEKLTEQGYKRFFRTCPRDDDQALSAEQVIQSRGYKRVALLHDNTLYSSKLAARTASLLKDAGIEIIADTELVPGKNDYRDILNAVKEKQPEVLFFTGYYPEAGVLLRQKKELGWTVPAIGGDASYSAELIQIAGKEAAEGFHFLSMPLIKNLPSPEAKQFLPEYNKKYDQPLTSIYGLLAGDAFKVICAAIAATGTIEADRISRYLHADMKNFPGLSGMISFDEMGDREGRIFVEYSLDKNGKPVLQL
jgi:branched-chain amino acid transport system substrate-binding protein